MITKEELEMLLELEAERQIRHVAFPADMVICDVCEFCRTENNGTRFRCLLNSRILPYHNRCIGRDCPLPITAEPGGDDGEI